MKSSRVFLLFILVLGLFLRLYGNNWDQGFHLHPDERFLTMVGNDISLPSTFSQYLDPIHSSFNPVNKGHTFYVYGTFPLLVNKILAEYLYNNTYDQFNLQGRVLSGCADFLIILIIFRLLELVEKKVKLSPLVKYVAAFFYAIAVFPIQLAHFFTVDTFLNLFAWASIYFAVKIAVEKKKGMKKNMICSGLSLGLAFACKVSAIYVAPLVGVLIFFGYIHIKESINKKIFLLFLFSFFCYFALRLGSPYYFQTGNFFDPRLSAVFLNNLAILKSFDNPSGLYPPGVQWLSKSFDFPIKNIIFFGVGPVYFLCALTGFILVLKKRNDYVFLFALWVIGFIILQSFQFAKTMRYLIFIYPLLAIFAAVGLSNILSTINRTSPPLRYIIYGVLYLTIVFWPLAFMSIYTTDHSRVAASKWIYEHIPARSTILTEYWDDPLPLMVQNPSTRNYSGTEVHIFDPDTSEKWQTINEQLKSTDYYIMSSNRGWGSISKVPDRYPITSIFYADMFKNKRGFTLVKEFASYPSLRYVGIPIDFPDQWSEEAFTVYDHPMVKIFKKN